MDFTYLCLTERMFPKRTAFAFLDDTKTRFCERYPIEVRSKALPNAMQESFKNELQVKVDTYNRQPENEKMQRLQNNLNDVKDQMTENIGSKSI